MGCPRSDAIAEASRETLPDDQLHSVYRHLEQCADCWKRYLRARTAEPELTVPGYHIIRGLGHGVSSVVYKAWRLSNPPELVALKLLWPANDDQRARFEREIAVLGRLRLPNIVKCRDSGQRGEMMYYAMDFVRGKRLDEYFKGKRRGLDRKLEVFERVCRALAGAHAQGVAHRDLKPNNILVDAQGQPHILDFGLCAVDSNEWDTWVHQAQTRPGDVMGTVKYMSPEQAWGGLLDGAIDYRADIWALGIILYELATDGGYPFDTGSTEDKTAEEAILHRIRTETPRPAQVSSPGHAHHLKRLIDRCLAWERRQRIQSVETLADDIARCRAHAPIRTKALSLRYRIQRISLGLVVRRRGLLWLCNVAAVLFLLSALTFVFDVRWQVNGFDLSKSGSPGLVGLAPDAREHILIAGITENTAQHVQAYAAMHGIPGATGDIRTWRAVHGHLMGRLSSASPRIVAWDFAFKGRRQGDAAFVKGIKSLHSAGIPAVLGVKQLDRQELYSSSGIYEPLRNMCNFGILKGRDARKKTECILAMRRGSVIWPSFALATFAVAVHPDNKLGIDWQNRERRFELVFEEWDRPGSILRDRHAFTLTSVYRIDEPESGLRPGDLLAGRTYALQHPNAWRKRTVAYEDLLKLSDAELSDLVAGKIVLFGDLRSPDLHDVKYNGELLQDVPGCYLMADAINSLLSDTYLKPAFPLNELTLFVMATFAALGCVLPVFVVRNGGRWIPSRKLICQAAILTASVAFCVAMVKAQRQPWIFTSMAGAALCITALASLWIEFARAQRRAPSEPGSRTRFSPTPATAD